jgi:hypothetical protein
MPAQRPADHAEYDRMAAAAAIGAGRSLRCDGVLSRRSPARSAGSAILLGWCKPQGSPQSKTAKRWPTNGKCNAVENAAAQVRPLPQNASASMVEGRSVVSPVRLTPAGWMPSASTWGS